MPTTLFLNTTPSGASIVSFAPPINLGFDSGSLAVADINGDGKRDLISLTGSGIGVLLNTTVNDAPVPSFGPERFIDSGTLANTFVAISDFNGDGKPDVVIVSYDSSAKSVAVLLNTTPTGGTIPTFTPKSFPAGGRSRFVAVADVNGDGRPDLIIPLSGTYSTAVLLNTTPPGAATPSFAGPQAFIGENGL